MTKTPWRHSRRDDQKKLLLGAGHEMIRNFNSALGQTVLVRREAAFKLEGLKSRDFRVSGNQEFRVLNLLLRSKAVCKSCRPRLQLRP
jgi:hypothetical protein